MEIKAGDVVLAKFYFTNSKAYKHRPVLALKDNLPFNDFVAIPISSQISDLQQDEYLINTTHFSIGDIPKESKIMLRKTFVVAKHAIVKKYGSISQKAFGDYHSLFCKYFSCCS